MNTLVSFLTLKFVSIYSQKISKSKCRSVKMCLIHANVSLFACYCMYLHAVCMYYCELACSICLSVWLASIPAICLAN